MSLKWESLKNTIWIIISVIFRIAKLLFNIGMFDIKLEIVVPGMQVKVLENKKRVLLIGRLSSF